MGAFSILLNVLGLNLGWVYLFMGIMIGSAVLPLWNMMTWKKASGKGAVISAWGGLVLALTGWIVGAYIQSGEINVASLGTNEVMLSGNLIAIFSSGIIHFLYSMIIDPQDYDFEELDRNITLVEAHDLSGLGESEKDPVKLQKAYIWISRRGYALAVILVLVWPILSIPAGVFTQSYFAFWVLVAIMWGFGAAIVITVLPLLESQDEIGSVFNGLRRLMGFNVPDEDPMLMGETPVEKLQDSEDAPEKEVDEPETKV